jgi:hypothetical protein
MHYRNLIIIYVNDFLQNGPESNFQSFDFLLQKTMSRFGALQTNFHTSLRSVLKPVLIILYYFEESIGTYPRDGKIAILSFPDMEVLWL